MFNGVNCQLSMSSLSSVNVNNHLLNLSNLGELLLGKMNPLLSILETGTTSVFLMISRFFQAVESLLAMREEFLRAFLPEAAVSQGIGLFEKIQDLKFNKLLPAKMRFLLNVEDNSEELGQLVFCRSRETQASGCSQSERPDLQLAQ